MNACQHQKQLTFWQALHADAKTPEARAEAADHIAIYRANVARGGW